MAEQDTSARESTYLISVATPDDIPEILALQSENQISRGGALSVEFPAQWFEAAIKDLPIVVARRDGRLVGYLVSSSQTSTQHLPLPQAKQRAYPAGPGAYNSGPLCIARKRAGTRPRSKALRDAAIAVAGARGCRLHSARQCRVKSRSCQVWFSGGR